MSFDLIDNSDAIKAALKEAAERALERCGSQAEGYASTGCNAGRI